MLKKINFKAILLFISCFNISFLIAQDSTGLAGDHFSLEAALEMFKKAGSPEEFEKLINEENNKVNNLDLNEDGQVDFVKVNEYQDGDVRLFVLSVDVSEKETQDIAVIELEKTGEESAVVQIIGDEAIFGESQIIEPGSPDDYLKEEDDAKGNGPNPFLEAQTIVVNVWFWPCVRHVYTIGYRPWRSAWRWGYYPAWWIPRRPWGWSIWRPYRFAYAGPHVRFVHTRRCVGGHRIYAPYHRHSTIVKTRYAPAHRHYKVTKSKTTVTGPRGNKLTKSKTSVTGPRGNKVTRSKTSTGGNSGKVKQKRTSPRKK
ncbi:MAG: hypothetical protein IPM48_00675 [Saprospiraceae bacterium]|nr:hypothetical protein [Saprospiraceae bacterium]